MPIGTIQNDHLPHWTEKVYGITESEFLVCRNGRYFWVSAKYWRRIG